MSGFFRNVQDVLEDDSLNVFWDELKGLFSSMDRAYRKAASHYGFVCVGCVDNCCLTEFHHHTLLEFHYLKKGFAALPSDLKKTVLDRAGTALGKYREAAAKGVKARVMCPLNFDDKCLVYSHRPMICRLHGIPSELNFPGRTKVVMPGCDPFTAQCGKMNYRAFDRTPLYRALSLLEKKFRERLESGRKMKMTVAEIVLCEDDMA